MTPNLPVLYAILLQAVKDMAYRPGLTVNSFALVDGMPNLDHESYGYTFEDYRAGNFWSRDWVGAGAMSSELRGQWPVLMPELRESRTKSSNTIEHTVDVTLVDHLTAAHCGPRSGPVVYDNLLRMALAVRGEVLSYGLYDTDEFGLVWSTENRMERIEGLQLSPLMAELKDYVKFNAEIRPWGDYPHLRGLYLSLTLTECIVLDGPAFRYDRAEPQVRGVVNCAGKCC